jgi:MFS superfamily sulfate permease-like transporter
MEFKKQDVASGFLVFLIALPLCMGIAIASGFPPLSGVITAGIGGMLTGLLGGSPLTIKGPAAGMIVIVLGAVQELQDPGDPISGFHRALAVGVIAGALQVLIGALRMGRIASMMPTSVIHGMLAAIGIIIISKQIHLAFGVTPSGTTPMALLMEIPASIANTNPAIALLGILSFVFMLGQPVIRAVLKKNVPSAILVLIVTCSLGFLLDLHHPHSYDFLSHHYQLDDHFLVKIPGSLISAITFPDWSHLFSLGSLKYVIIFTLVGSIESLLTVSAVDAIDPEKRRSDLNKDLMAVGAANVVASLLGGLPMISEIVRSKANIDSGAKTMWANFTHGALLVGFTLLLPGLLREIPVAALAGILVYVGTRLASPKEFSHVWHLGPEQFFFFLLTCVLTVTVDLLVGVGVGLAVSVVYCSWTSRSIRSLLGLQMDKEPIGDDLHVRVQSAAMFSNFPKLEAELRNAEESGQYKKIVVDFSNACLVEHTFLEKLHAFSAELASTELVPCGLADHRAMSQHELATRVKSVGTRA